MAAADPKIPSSRFTVEPLRPKERYEVWRESIACIFDVEGDRDIRRGDRFRARIDAHMIGPVMLARTTSLQQDWKRSPLTVARNGMDHYMIQHYEDGHQQCTYRGGSVEMPANGLIVYDLSQEVFTRTSDFTNISLIIPRPMLDAALRSPDSQHMRVITGSEPLVAVLRDHMRTVADQADRLTLREGMELGPVMVGLAAACLNASIQDTPGGRFAVDHATLTAIKREIEARLDDRELTPADLCRRSRISRTRLYELFEPIGGVFHYIRERRLRTALLALLDPTQDRKLIYQIAYDAGFNDESSFSRTFRKRFGFSPRDVRRGGARGEDRNDGMMHEGVLDRRYEQWLHTLPPTG